MQAYDTSEMGFGNEVSNASFNTKKLLRNFVYTAVQNPTVCAGSWPRSSKTVLVEWLLNLEFSGTTSAVILWEMAAGSGRTTFTLLAFLSKF